ncbi:hypothetical protein SSS_05848 [Sarcoptes scabiei]|nr:hypothetical protein SSS_05848 [Sarcoptes scabiei]
MAIIYEILKAYRRLNSFRVLQMQRETLKQQFRRQNVKLTSNSSEILDGSKMESIIATDPTEQMNSFVGNHPSYGMTSQTDLDSSSSSRTTNTNSNEPINSSNVHFSVDPMLPAAPATTTTTTAASPSLSSSLNNRKSLPLFATIGQMFSRTNLYSTLLYSLQVFFAYYLMLAFMLFNVWICLSIVLGAAFGHFLLAEHSTTLADHNVEDYCH